MLTITLSWEEILLRKLLKENKGMKVLIVCSGNFPNPEKNFPIHQAFIYDQIVALQKQHDVQFETFLIQGKGFRGYLSNIKSLRKKINSGNFNLVHAHFSLSGLVSVIASKIPVIVTYHGSDINKKLLNIISSLTSIKSAHNIYVSDQLYKKAYYKPRNYSTIPCGVDFDIYACRYTNSGESVWEAPVVVCSEYNIQRDPENWY